MNGNPHGRASRQRQRAPRAALMGAIALSWVALCAPTRVHAQSGLGGVQENASSGAAGLAQGGIAGAPSGGAAGAAQGGATSASQGGSTGAPKNENTASEPSSDSSPELRAVSATSDIVRGVLNGGAVDLELSQALSRDADVRVELRRLDERPTSNKAAMSMEVQGFPEGHIIATVPKETEAGLYEVRVWLATTPPAERTKPSSAVPAKQQQVQRQEVLRPQKLRVHSVASIAAIAALPILAVAVLVAWLLAQEKRSPSGGRTKVSWLLLYEPENQTYSLSRAQFLLWSAAITAAYVFIFVGQGRVRNVWEFPSLKGFGMTFLLSLGTLVAAQTTSAIKGSKGSGQYHPSLGDLIVHGGVLALERVQQLVWTLIAIGMFLVIVFKNYSSTTELPAVPDELLVLMGISSAGYLAGKMARKAGPVIARVRAAAGSVLLTIEGKRLSKDASVWVDGKQLEQKAIAVQASADQPEFANEIQIVLGAPSNAAVAPAAPNVTLADWLANEHSLSVVNDDGQRAEWRSNPAILSVVLEPSAEANRATLRVTTEYLGSNASFSITGGAERSAKPVVRMPLDSRVWEVPITLTGGTAKGQITATAGSGLSVSTEWSATDTVQ